MYSESLSVPEAARSIISSNAIYLQAIELGIANYTALAERIKPEVERMIGSKANTNTIVVAIKRFADTIQKEQQQKAQGSENADSVKAKMSLTGSILDIDFENAGDDSLTEILDGFFEHDSRKYNLFQTDNHFTLLAEDVEEVRNAISTMLGKFDGTLNEGLSKITIALGPKEENPYHLLSVVSSILYNHKIPIHSAFFTGNELVVVLSDKSAAKAYDLIRMKIG